MTTWGRKIGGVALVQEAIYLSTKCMATWDCHHEHSLQALPLPNVRDVTTS